MRLICLIILLWSVGAPFASAGDHIAVNIEKSGLQKVINSVINYYLRNDQDRSLILEPNTVSGKIELHKFEENQLVSLLGQFLHLEQDQNVNYTIKWDEIKIESGFDENNIEIQHKGQGKSFQSALGIAIDELTISSPKIEICEFFDQASNTCDETRGLYGRFENLSIQLNAGSLIKAVIESRIDISEDNIRLNFEKVSTNLNNAPREKTLVKSLNDSFLQDAQAPSLGFSFTDLYIPPPVLIVNGRRIPLKVDKLKDAILAEREFIAAALTRLLGDFVARDLVELVNESILGKLKDIKSRLFLVDYNRGQYVFREFQTLSRENPQEALEFLRQYSHRPEGELTPMERLQFVLRNQISEAKSYCDFNRIETPESRNLSLFFDSQFMVNGETLQLTPTIKNGKEDLGTISFSEFDLDSDLSIGLSESFFNGLFKLSAESSLMQSLFKEFVKIKGVTLDGLNVHFVSFNNSCAFDNLKVVANVRVKISDVESDGVLSWISNQIGSWLEDDEVWFPVEIDFQVNSLGLKGENILELMALNPFADGELRNTYNYPLKDMKGVVKKSIFKTLKKELEPMLQENIRIDLTDHLEAIPGVKFTPTKLMYSNEGHLILGIHIEHLNLEELQELAQ